MNDLDIIDATGLDHAVTIRARCAPLGDKPGLIVGNYGPHATIVIRYWPDEVGVSAIATVSKSPTIIGGMDREEQERLRGENLTPSGASAPVGQEVAAAAAQGVPYAPPVPPGAEVGGEEWAKDPALDSTAVEDPDDDTELSDVSVEPAPCGNPDCIVFNGPEGRKEVHVEGCPA